MNTADEFSPTPKHYALPRHIQRGRGEGGKPVWILANFPVYYTCKLKALQHIKTSPGKKPFINYKFVKENVFFRAIMLKFGDY